MNFVGFPAAARKLKLAQPLVTTQHLQPQRTGFLAAVIASVIPHGVTASACRIRCASFGEGQHLLP